MPSLLIRADGGAGVGNGHLARCLALAQAWVDSGGRATLVPPPAPSSFLDRYRAEGVDVGAAEEGPPHVDWAVMDGYRIGRADHEAAIAGGARLLVVDDHGAVGDYERADVVLDQNLGASADTYANRSPRTDLLLGPRYALLRREFRTVAEPGRRHPERARTVVVTLGGSPPPDAVALVKDALAILAGDGLRAVWLSGGENDVTVTSAMAAADVALSASGSTCWELCHTGVPAVLVPIAPNQLPLAAALQEAGAATDAGSYEELTPAKLARRVSELVADAGRRTLMSERGRQLVDGRGAIRVVARLRADLLTLRAVREDDCRLLWEWANDPVVRAAAFTTRAIPWHEHRAWFEASLAESSRFMYLASDPDGEALGQVRFDVDGPEAIVGVSVAARQRGRGWGAPLIDAGVRRLLGDAGVDVVRARIKPENAGSIAAFDAAGFSSEGMRTDGNGTWCQYARWYQDHAQRGAAASVRGREPR